MEESIYKFELLEGEVFKAIPEFENYHVSNMGRVYSPSERCMFNNNGIKKSSLNKTGYYATSLTKNGKVYTFLVHTLVLITFVGPKPIGYETRHLNSNPTDNRLENLAWGTPKENANDRILLGTSGKGENHSRNIFTEESIRDIRTLLSNNCSLEYIAKKYNITHKNIYQIKTGVRWGWLDDYRNKYLNKEIIMPNYRQGEHNSKSTLTKETVDNIKQMLSSGKTSYEISKLLNIKSRIVSNIAIGKNWKHI